MRISFRRYKILEVLDYFSYTSRSQGRPGLWVLLIGVMGKGWWRPISRPRISCNFGLYVISSAVPFWLVVRSQFVRSLIRSPAGLSAERFACGLLFGFAKPWRYLIASVLYTLAPLWPLSFVDWDREGVRDIAETSEVRGGFSNFGLYDFS